MLVFQANFNAVKVYAVFRSPPPPLPPPPNLYLGPCSVSKEASGTAVGLLRTSAFTKGLIVKLLSPFLLFLNNLYCFYSSKTPTEQHLGVC